jgi:hypothetical protein
MIFQYSAVKTIFPAAFIFPAYEGDSALNEMPENILFDDSENENDWM